MATTPTVLGTGPFEFTDNNGNQNGNQVSIPLSALKFTGGVASVDSTKWPNATQQEFPSTLVNSLLKDLSQRGLIVPGPAPAPQPAVVITAADPGAPGNNIQIAFVITTFDVDPTQVKFQATVTVTESYPGLSLDPNSANFIETVLGKVSGPNPTLVHVADPPAPVAGIPASVTVFATGANSFAQATVQTADSPPKTLFVLEAKKKGSDGQNTSASVKNATSTSFDLSVSWQNAAIDLTLSNMQANIATALGYEITVAPPASAFLLPSGTVQLSGGNAGTKASGIAFAAQ